MGGCVSSAPRTGAVSTNAETVEQAENMGNSNKKQKAAQEKSAGEEKPTIVITKTEPPVTEKKKAVGFSVTEEEVKSRPTSETLEKLNPSDAARSAFYDRYAKGNTGVKDNEFNALIKGHIEGITDKDIRTIFQEFEMSQDDDDDSSSLDLSNDEDDEDNETQEQTLQVSPKFDISWLEKQYEVENEVGRGAFGVVSLGYTTVEHKTLPPRKKVAIKKMVDIFGNPSGTKRLIRELRVLRYLSHHPALTQLLDVKIPKPHDLTKFDTILMVFECMDCDVTTHLKNPHIQYSEPMLKHIIKQIICGLKYLHTAAFVHRDLKPQNLLLRDLGKNRGVERWQCKICDFGLARCIKRNRDKPQIQASEIFDSKNADPNALRPYKFQPKITKHVVTRYYRAPEISLLIQQRDLLPAIDIWSVGCIMGEMLQMIPGNELGMKNGRPTREILLKGAADLVLSPRTFHNRPIISKQQLNVIFKFLGTPSDEYINTIKNQDLRRWIQSQERRPAEDVYKLFSKSSKESLDFMCGMLAYDPTKRFNVDDCLESAWLQAKDDKMNQSHEEIKEDFEDVYLNDHQLRLMVVDEILHFNPGWKEHLKLQYTSIVNKTQTKLQT